MHRHAVSVASRNLTCVRKTMVAKNERLTCRSRIFEPFPSSSVVLGGGPIGTFLILIVGVVTRVREVDVVNETPVALAQPKRTAVHRDMLQCEWCARSASHVGTVVLDTN